MKFAFIIGGMIIYEENLYSVSNFYANETLALIVFTTIDLSRTSARLCCKHNNVLFMQDIEYVYKFFPKIDSNLKLGPYTIHSQYTKSKIKIAFMDYQCDKTELLIDYIYQYFYSRIVNVLISMLYTKWNQFIFLNIINHYFIPVIILLLFVFLIITRSDFTNSCDMYNKTIIYDLLNTLINE